MHLQWQCDVCHTCIVCLQVPLEELDLRRLREAAEEMREQLGLTSKAVSSAFTLAAAVHLACQATAVVWDLHQLRLHHNCSGLMQTPILVGLVVPPPLPWCTGRWAQRAC